MKLSRTLAALGVSAGALAALATPALASSPQVTVTLTTGGSRTMNLYEADGTTPLTTTDLSTGSSNFVAQVQDATYTNQAFTVQSTMTNLYPYSNNAYQCTARPFIPSSAVSLSSPSGLLTVAGVSAATTPVFTLTGTLTSSNVPGLLSTVTLATTDNPPTTAVGVLPTTPLTQTALTGSGGSLFGSTLSGVESKLPVSLSTPNTGGAFANPDAHSTCDPSATGATPVQIMHGTANPTGLVGDLINQISTAVCNTNNTTLGTDPTLSALICAGYLTNNAVSTAVQSNSTLMAALGGLAGLTPTNLTDIENTLTAPLTSTALSLLSGATSQSGTYDSSPSLVVTVPSGSSGTYEGVMTVTLVDGQ
jgi:hypothetical protein